MDKGQIADEYLESFVVSKLHVFTLGLFTSAFHLTSQSSELTWFKLSENNTTCVCVIWKYIPKRNINYFSSQMTGRYFLDLFCPK